MKLLLIINFILFAIVNSAPIFSPIQTMDQVTDYLKKFGYMSPMEDGTGMNSLSAAIKAFQEEFGLRVTEMLDAETMNAMGKPRCKMSNINMTMGMINTDVLYKLHDPTVKMNIFTWTINKFSEKLDKSFQYDAVEKGLQKWADKCDLIFHRADVENAHIRVNFDTIDNPGSILAFAFYPGYSNSGKQIYDKSEKWTKDESGQSLQYVVTHETGHTLGIMHSSNGRAIMYPAYNYEGGDYSLHEDDENACLLIFGKKKENGCFSANGKVLLQDGRTVLMRHLQVGDVVQTSANSFGPVVTLLDRNEKASEMFTILKTRSGKSIELTRKHLIAIKSVKSEGKDYVFAENVLLGSKLYSIIDGKEVEDEVISISSDIYQGYYAPLTFHGTIVVNSIQASCYAEVESQVVAHWSMLPLRSLSYIHNMFFLSKAEDFENVHWYGRLSKRYALPIAEKLGIL